MSPTTYARGNDKNGVSKYIWFGSDDQHTCQCGIESKARENNVIIVVQVEKEEKKTFFLPLISLGNTYIHTHTG
jgi:hypothetical protein